MCNHGLCQTGCDADLTACGSSCVDLKHDPNHCGSCDTSCQSDEVCASVGGQPQCRKYKWAGCTSCTGCDCQGRACCLVVSSQGEYQALCVDGACPL
jgi:hypothetical protein